RATGGASYGNQDLPDDTPDFPPDYPRPQEWKTPPLWGVADSAPYFHDGRAPTLEAAIARHGGDAAPVAKAYDQLVRGDREAVIAFLKPLRAPPQAAQVASSSQSHDSR